VLNILNRKWAFAGACLGTAIPVAIRIYQVLSRSSAPAVISYLFWPTIVLINFNFAYPIASMLVALLGNALLFGAVAGMLRKSSIFILFTLSISAWFLLPPSDAALKRRFEQHRVALQEFVQMSKADSEIVRITSAQFEATNGEVYSDSEGEKALPQRRRAEYTRRLRALDMREAMFNRAGTGEVYIGAQTLGIGAIKSYYGYVYCPQPPTVRPSYLPCINGNDSGGWSSVRYARLDRNWYIYKVSGPYYIE
jgi:hypothetical protein